MTASNDAVDRIAEVLRAHIWYFVGNLGVPGMPDQKGYKCYCGWETHADGERPADDPHAHVGAAVVAELQLTQEWGVMRPDRGFQPFWRTNERWCRERVAFLRDHYGVDSEAHLVTRWVSSGEKAE